MFNKTDISMIKTLAKSPFMKINVDFIQPAKNLYKEFFSNLPELDFKTSYSSLDEGFTIETTTEGKEIKKIYFLKCSENNQKFSYKHTFEEGDSLEDIKSNAHKQLVAWKEEQKLKLNNKTIENGN